MSITHFQNIKTYTKPHGSGNTDDGEGKVIIINRGSNGQTNTFNPYNVDIVNLNAHNGKIDNLKATNANIDNAEIIYLMSPNGTITEVNGTDLIYKNGSIDELQSDTITTNKLTANDQANIKNLISEYISSTDIVTDNLTVNKTAHFFELIVDKIRSVQGTQMNTAANCVVDYVEAYDVNDHLVDLDDVNVDYYRIYWKNKDAEGKEVKNEWLPYDQAMCESFNVNQGGTYETQNKYYWRLVRRVDGGYPEYVNFEKGEVRHTIPSFSIRFNSIFNYGSDIDPTYNYTNFIVHSQKGHYENGQWVDEEWDNTVKRFYPSSTLYGLQITPTESDNKLLYDGKLLFVTDINTKLNVGIYYDDNTFEYFPADNYKTNYSIETSSTKNIKVIIINTAVIDKWEECNWIDLGNVNASGQPKEYDDDATHNPDGKTSIPTIGDNICQLGFRYDMYQPTDPEYDPSRASAIIIAAYNTPDSGVTPPSYAQYQDITDFSLSTHRKTFFDANGGTVIGNFKVQTTGGDVDLDQYIQSQTTIQEAEILIEANNAEIDMCVFQVDNADQIHDLNNFPGWTDTNGRRNLYISIYTQQQYTPIFVKCNLFGRTVTLLDIDPNTGTPRLLPTPDSGNGIYVYSVTQAATNKLCVTFDFRGTDQTITNGSSVEFYGQVTINGTTYNPSKSITIASVQNGHGIDADMYTLNKLKEEAIVNGDKNLIVHLQYGIRHIVGNSATIVPRGQYMSCEAIVYMSDNSTRTFQLSYDSTNNYFYYDDTSITNYYNWTSAVPLYYQIQLKNSNDSGTTYFIADSVLVNINLGSRSLFTVEEDMITAITTETNDRTAQYGQLSVQAGLISAHVDTIDQGLSSTGIDITNGKIGLRGDNVTFTNSAGTVSGKISIDSITGTLHAVDGDFSGTINATNSNFSGTVNAKGSIGTNNQTYNISLNSDDTSLKIIGARGIKMDPSTHEPIIPYERYSSSTPDFDFFTLYPGDWIAATNNEGMLNPQIIMKQPYSNSPSNNDCSKIVVTPNGIYFYDIYNDQETLKAIIGSSYIRIPGVSLREYFNNADAKNNGGLEDGDLYRTGDTLKIVHS